MRTQERVNQMNDLITGIARRSAYKFLTKDAEELAQDLWLHVLEKEEDKGEELDLDLIAKICYNRIVDIQRFDARRNSISLDQLFESVCNGDYENDDSEDFRDLRPGAFSQPDNLNKILINDLFNSFSKGSKERLFLEYWATATGFKDFGIHGDGTYGDGYTESDLARKLGYAGTSSGGYKSFRHKMRTVVIGFFEG